MEFPAAFGNYQLLERIATGGMAELFLARSIGVEGFEKRLVIKRILPALSRSPRFVSLFIHEAKISAMLSHPNIVQIFDLNQVGDDYYIAMEYIHGRDLTRVLRRLRALGRRLPVGMAVGICAAVARGLAYAHSRADPQGNPLHVVHRDVSPHNILLSFQGEVKLVDFGIARLEGAEGVEEPGGLQGGKYAYMSPEQASGLPLDRRSDVFSCAVVLWELLSGRRLFDHPDPAEKLRRVREAELPALRALLPELPEALEAILRRALARRPEERTASADLFEEELRGFLFERGEPPDPGALGALLRELFADELGEDPCVEVLRGLARDLGQLDAPGPLAQTTLELPPDDPTVEAPVAAAGPGGRRGAVVLVAERLGMTDASDALEPEALLRAERAQARALGRLVAQYGGRVEDPSHDALVAVFGAPVAHEDDPDRALACAGHLLRAAERLGSEGRALRLAVGVHRGEVTLSEGEDGRCLPRGSTFKLARRLAESVEPGQIAVSQELARALAPRWRFAPGPPLRRGDERAMLLKGRQRVVRGGHGRRWVRRGAELEVLSAALDDLAWGRGGLLTLCAEAGQGKTRLVQELVERAERAGLPTVATRAAPYGGAVPLAALRELVAAACGMEDTDGPERARARLAGLSAVGLSPEDLTALAALFDAAPGAQVSEAGRQAAFMRLVRGMAAERPLLVVVEDAPHLGRSERALLAQLVRATHEHRVLWLVTSREPTLPWLPPPQHAVVLPPLDVEGRLGLIRDVLGVRGVSAGLFTFLEQNAEGRPLYLVELLAALQEHGLLRVEGGRAALSDPTAPLVLPPGLEAILAARVDCLEAPDRAALRVAAVIGFSFSEALLARATGRAELGRALAAMGELGLVGPEGQPGRWSFGSQLVWEVVRRPLVGEPLREVHRAVAEAMVRLYSQRPGPYAQAIAEHYAAGGRTLEAVTWMERAGDELRRGAFLERALDAFRRGVAWAVDLAEEPEHVRLAAEASLRLKAGEVAQLLGESAEASRHLQLALDIAGDLNLTELECGCALSLGRLYADAGDAVRAQATLEHGLAEARRCGLRELQVELLEALAQLACSLRDWPRAETALQEAMDLAGDDQGLRALAWLGLGQRHWAARDMVRAAECLQAARACAATEGDRLLLGRVVNLLGIVLHAQGRYDEALASFREALELRRGTGLRAGVAVNLHNIGEALLRLGEPGRAWAALAQSREEAEAAGLERVVVMNDLYLGFLGAQQGEPAGRARLRHARERARALQDEQSDLTGAWLEARLEQAAGRTAVARELLTRGLHEARARGAAWIARDMEEELARLGPALPSPSAPGTA